MSPLGEKQYESQLPGDRTTTSQPQFERERGKNENFWYSV